MEGKRKQSSRTAGGSGEAARLPGGQRSSHRRLEEALAAVVQEAYREVCGHPGRETVEVPLELSARVHSGRPWKVRAEPSLAEQVKRAVREAGARELVFHRGRVFCYRCESSLCPHGHPPSPAKVFGGYSPTGLPRWVELTEIMIAMKHPRIEALFDSSARMLAAAYMDSPSLKHRQLGVFGRQSKTYDILCQVVVGYLRFPLRKEGAGGGEKVALTLQAVEIRDRSRKGRVVLNVLGNLADGSPAVESLEGAFQMRILDSVVTARRLLARLGGQGRKPSAAIEKPADKIMRKTAGALERLGRQSERRTGHAEYRRAEKRPTSKALEDALAAQDEALLWDDRKKTVIVCGGRTRVHVFSLEGKHVTSFSLKREELDGRVRRRRWNPLSSQRRRDFRDALAGTGAAEGRPQRRMSGGT